MPGAVAKAFASELAADRSPSRKVVVVLTITEPGTMLSILTETLLSGYAISIMLMNCRQHPFLKEANIYTKMPSQASMMVIAAVMLIDISKVLSLVWSQLCKSAI